MTATVRACYGTIGLPTMVSATDRVREICQELSPDLRPDPNADEHTWRQWPRLFQAGEVIYHIK